ncbi:MAG: hypothetical protein ACKO2V_17270 [Snowella sp.]
MQLEPQTQLKVQSSYSGSINHKVGALRRIINFVILAELVTA